MRIQVDEEGKAAVFGLVDIARKVVNLPDIPKLMDILSHVSMLSDDSANPPEPRIIPFKE